MTSWKATSASASFTRFPSAIVASKFFAAFQSSSSCSSVIRMHAFSMERFSSAIRTSSTSFRSFSVILATCAPLRGIITTSPSSSSLRIASRTGVLLTPRRSASAISISRSPGLSSPFKIALRSVLNTTSRSGRYSFISTEKSFIIGSFPFPAHILIYA